AGHSSEAIRCFMHVAENYRLNGFNLKAIAMLKKVSKIDSANVEIGLKLAALYAQQKLIVDARNQYLSVAEHYVREGQAQKALDIYQKVADLDPENTSIQIKLAEAYLREGQTDQAYEAFIAAAGELRRQHKEEEALEVYLRSLSANPQGQIALTAVINLYIQRNDIPNAISLIEKLLQERPNDAELLILLSRVHQSRNDLEKAERAIARAFTSDPARYQYVIDLATLFLNRSDIDGALRQFDRIAEKLFEYREEEKGVLLLREVLAQDAHHFGALERLSNLYSRTHEDHLLIETLNTLAEAAIHQGHSQTAVNALGQLLQLEPDEIQHRRRLRVLGLSDEEVQGLTSATAPIASETEQSEITREIKVFTTSTHLEAVNPEFVPQEQSFNDQHDDQASASDFSSYNPESAVASPTNFESVFISEEASNETDDRLNPDASETHQPFNYQNGKTTKLFEEESRENFLDSNGSQAALNISDEIESIEFYIAQGMLDVARYTLNTLEQQFPKHPEVIAIRTQLETAELANDADATDSGLEQSFLPKDSLEQVAALDQANINEPVKWFNNDVSSAFTEEESKAIFVLSPQAPIISVGQIAETLPLAESNAIQSPLPQFTDAAQPFELLDGPEEGELLSLLDEFKAEV
ncbi:MAG TPA: tetratricopeptide repeat protein, partial [Blastocatellia bacterium]|nr:tetratricopeptide repeat protein [Blastocatellia bacterium]